MAKQAKFLVTGPTAYSNKRTIISRHATLEAARRALRLAKGSAEYRIEAVQ